MGDFLSELKDIEGNGSKVEYGKIVEKGDDLELTGEVFNKLK